MGAGSQVHRAGHEDKRRSCLGREMVPWGPELSGGQGVPQGCRKPVEGIGCGGTAKKGWEGGGQRQGPSRGDRWGEGLGSLLR